MKIYISILISFLWIFCFGCTIDSDTSEILKTAKEFQYAVEADDFESASLVMPSLKKLQPEEWRQIYRSAEFLDSIKISPTIKRSGKHYIVQFGDLSFSVKGESKGTWILDSLVTRKLQFDFIPAEK